MPTQMDFQTNRAMLRKMGITDAVLAGAQKYYGVSDFTLWQTNDGCIYDEIFVPSAGTNSFSLFVVPAGAPDPNRPAVTITKTAEQTNIQQSNAVGGAECWAIMSFHLGLAPAPKARQQVANVAAQATFAADQLLASRWIQGMTMKGVLQVSFNKNIFLQQTMPFRYLPLGFGLGTVKPPVIGGVTAPISGGANAVAAMSNMAIYEMGDIFTLDQPLFLAPNTNLEWSVLFPEGNSLVTTGLYNGAGTTHTEIGTMLCYGEMRGVKLRPMQ